MTTKEKIIRKSISQIEKELLKINSIMDSKPGTEIINIRIEAQKILQEYKTIEQRTSVEFLEKIKVLSDREKEQFALARKGRNSAKLIDKKVKLESELSALRRELYYINLKQE